MSSIRKNLQKWLLDQSSLTAIVGTRIWPIKRPGTKADTVPCLVFVKTKAMHDADLSAGNGNRDHVFHLIAVADEYNDVDAIYEVLCGESGLLHGIHGITMNGQKITGACIEDDFDHAEFDIQGAGFPKFMITIVVKISTGDGG